MMGNVQCFSDLHVPVDIQLVCAVCKYTPGDTLRASCAIFMTQYIGYQRADTPLSLANNFRHFAWHAAGKPCPVEVTPNPYPK